MQQPCLLDTVFLYGSALRSRDHDEDGKRTRSEGSGRKVEERLRSTRMTTQVQFSAYLTQIGRDEGLAACKAERLDFGQ